MRKLLIGALLLLIPLGSMGYENYKYQYYKCIAPSTSAGCRARDMLTGNYFRGYWTIINAATGVADAAIVEAHNLNGTTGASAQSLTFTIRHNAAFSGIVYCDSLYVTNTATTAPESIYVWCHGDRVVGWAGP